MGMAPEEYRRSADHHRHCPGGPVAPEWNYYEGRLRSELGRVFSPMSARARTDRAWTVMLYRQGLIARDVAAKLLTALEGAEHEAGGGGEGWLKGKLDGDEDTASAVNYGRTAQEPMSRLQLRDKMLDVLALLTQCLGVILDAAEKHVNTIMAGRTHFSHAQPTTYAAYLLSIHDGFARALEQLELAYKHTNQNTAGCGALAGTGWNVDRRLVTELLGFDALVEPTYDSEPGQDHALAILFALTSMMTLLSRTMMDHEIWGMEDSAIIRMPAGYLGQSSLMPQKAHPGSRFERVRIETNRVTGEMMHGVLSVKGEPHQDILPIYEAWRGALRALCHAEKALGFFRSLLPNVQPDKERMVRLAREGFSAAPDLAIGLIRERGLGGRRAHRICGTFVRIARERGIAACDTTGELLDEAARIAGEDPPGLSTEEVREALNPVKFIERHNNVGDPAPEESLRMIRLRRDTLAEARGRHRDRVARIENAAERLAREIHAIMAEPGPSGGL